MNRRAQKEKLNTFFDPSSSKAPEWLKIIDDRIQQI